MLISARYNAATTGCGRMSEPSFEGNEATEPRHGESLLPNGWSRPTTVVTRHYHSARAATGECLGLYFLVYVSVTGTSPSTVNALATDNLPSSCSIVWTILK